MPVLAKRTTTQDSAHLLCAEYQWLGLPAHTEGGVILLRTGIAVTALQLPGYHGLRVMGSLRAHISRGPIMARSRTRLTRERWTIFCVPDRWPTTSEKDILRGTAATVCVSGTALRLPDAHTGHGRP
jgi:hypothetical protein